MLKTIIAASFIVLLSSCSKNESQNQPADQNNQNGNTDISDGSTTDQNAPQAQLDAKFGATSWKPGSVVAVAGGPQITIYFAKKPGYNCNSRPTAADFQEVASLTLPAEVKNYGPMSQQQMSFEKIAGFFYETIQSFRLADSADVNIKEVSKDKISGEIKFSSGKDFSVVGQFSGPLCK